MKIPTCFFCYAWGDEERYAKLDFIRQSLKEHALSRIDVILDKHNYEDNANFDALRERIRTYDLVVVFCTPDLKEIVNDSQANNNKNREVLKEYEIIKERYIDNPSSVFVVILEGDKDSSLLDLFININARNIEEFGITRKNGKLSISSNPNTNRKNYKLFMSNVLGAAQYNFNNKTVKYGNSLIAMNNLFSLTDVTHIPSSCLIIPDLYSFIRNQQCYLVAGRKGSGKSTFINNFREMDKEYFDEKYKHDIPIYADAFQHDFSYSTLIVGHKEELQLITADALLRVFWQVYIVLHGILTIRGEIELHKIKENDSRYRIFNKVTNKLKKKIGLQKKNKSYKPISSDGVADAMFRAAVEMVDERFNTALKDCQNDELLLTAFASRLTAQDIIEDVFGERDIDQFIDALQQCNRKIFISLDGFDTHSDEFRIRTASIHNNDEEVNRRNEYDMLFYRTLVEVVNKFKRKEYNDPIVRTFSDMIDFCIVLPKDRFDQIVEYDRDSIKKRFGDLSWSALGLMRLIIKRLEYLVSVLYPDKKIDSSQDCYVQLNNLLDMFPGLPKTITMTVCNNNVEMSLFNYILRSSIWRPRDIISNLSCILSCIVHFSAGGKWVADSNVHLTEEEVRLTIRDNVSRIIREELYDEYKYVFRNLEDVLLLFKNQDELMKYNEFMDIINGAYFDASYSYDLKKSINKLLVLYQLGLVGLCFDKDVSTRMGYQHNVCFVFNAGMKPFEDVKGQKIPKDNAIHIAFNPMLIRELSLNFNSKELIGNWTEEYVKQNDRTMHVFKPL